MWETTPLHDVETDRTLAEVDAAVQAHLNGLYATRGVSGAPDDWSQYKIHAFVFEAEADVEEVHYWRYKYWLEGLDGLGLQPFNYASFSASLFQPGQATWNAWTAEISVTDFGDFLAAQVGRTLIAIREYSQANPVDVAEWPQIDVTMNEIFPAP
jgi:hypothetical protein